MITDFIRVSQTTLFGVLGILPCEILLQSGIERNLAIASLGISLPLVGYLFVAYAIPRWIKEDS